MQFHRIKLVVARLVKTQGFAAAIILIFVLALFYRDVVFGGRTFLMETATWGTMPSPSVGPYNYHGVNPGFVAIDAGAIAWDGEPYNRFISQSIKRGDFPLWDPYTGPAGAPLFADGYTAPLEPIQLLFFLAPTRFWPYTVDFQLLLRFFLAGFFCYLFSRRLKIGFVGSVSAGVCFMLGTYFVFYGDHPQIKTEALLPAVLYGYERLATSGDKRGAWLCSLFIGWALIAGMPESVLFTLALGTLWYYYRQLTRTGNAGINSGLLKAMLLRYAAFTVLGFLIAAAYLLPLLEFIQRSTSAHLGGSSNLTFPFWLVSNLLYQSAPGLYQHVRLGLVPIFSVTYSVLSIKVWPTQRRHVVFFSTYVVVILLVLFPLPFTAWILNLPVLRQVGVWKYAFPSIEFCAAIATAIFIDQVSSVEFSVKRAAGALALIAVFIFGVPALSDPSQSLALYYSNHVLGLFGFVLLVCIAIILLVLPPFSSVRQLDYVVPLGLLLLLSRKSRPARIVQLGVLFLLLSEPFYWSRLIMRPSRIDPYQVPPFVEYLRSDNAPFRIFGMDNILFPNISSAYKIADVRWLNPLVDQRAYEFATTLIAPDEPWGMRFTGIVFPISDRMFDLLNVKYVLTGNYASSGLAATCPVLSTRKIAVPDQLNFGANALQNQILTQNSLSWFGDQGRLSINDSPRLALSAFASATYKVKLVVPPEATWLNFSIGLRPDTFHSDRGDGVDFKICLSDYDKTTVVFSRYVDPKNNPCDRQWIDEFVDLEYWAGKQVVLSFATDPGPAGNSDWDLSYWGNLALTSQSAAPSTLANSADDSHYSPVYEDKSALIYENNRAFPRSFILYRVVAASNFSEFMKLLSDPAFDPKNAVAVENLPSQIAGTINQNSAPTEMVAAKTTFVNSGRVDVQADTPAPGLLILTDQYYPGWEALVDGKPAPIYAVDGIFRGVSLDTGRHTVVFRYRPLSFLLGAILSACAVLTAIAGLAAQSGSWPRKVSR